MRSHAASQIMDAASQKAAEVGKPVSIAIVDAGGSLMSLERLGDAPSATVMVAEGKAVASAVMGRDSGRLEAMAQSLPLIINSMMMRYDGRFVPAQGGVVIRQDEEVVGAIGVSGATSDEDEAIARAGAEAYEP